MMRVLVIALSVAALSACSAPKQVEPDRTPQLAEAPTDVQSETAAEFDPKLVFPKWYEPTEPFRVLGNLHYVGSAGLAVWFIPTERGHIVIDGGAPETATLAISGIRKLGYDPSRIAILLNTHAHFDHSGGLAELKALSGAQMIASEGDRSALEGGFYLGSETETVLNAPPVQVDRIIEHGEVVALGGVELTAEFTPGHSRGCTSWTLKLEEDGAVYDALVFCSATVAANRLTNPPQYDGIVQDYRATFSRISTWTPDVFLSNHSEFFDMETKRVALEAGDPLAFVDRERFPILAKRLQDAFEAELENQTAAAEEP